MKILSVGNFGHGWDGSICDEEHIAGALEELGHEVTRWQREEVDMGGLAGKLLETKPEYDFVLIAQWDGYPYGVFGNFKRVDSVFTTKFVYWAFDYQADGQGWHEKLINDCDLYLSKRIADSKYDNWQWLSQDFSPKFLDNYPSRYPIIIDKDIDVLFTGTYLDFAHERNETLKSVDEKFNLVIHSVNPEAWRERGFKNVNGPVMDDMLPELYARARVNLSIDHTIEAGYWSDRNAQIMACGGLVMFRYVPLSKSIFKDHVVYFHDVEDCLHRLGQLLERPQEDLDSVADGGYKYAHEYMMVEDRAKDLITIVEGIL